MNFSLLGEVERITVPKDVHILIRRSCEYATLLGKRVCIDVITLRTLSWEDYPGLSGWAQGTYQGPSKRKARRSWAEKKWNDGNKRLE